MISQGVGSSDHEDANAAGQHSQSEQDPGLALVARQVTGTGDEQQACGQESDHDAERPGDLGDVRTGHDGYQGARDEKAGTDTHHEAASAYGFDSTRRRLAVHLIGIGRRGVELND